MGEFSPTRRKGDCEEIANLSTAFGRRRRNWVDAHGSVPPGQVVDASCGNKHCIALRHSYLRPRVEQQRKYSRIAERVRRLKIGQHFDVPGVGPDERSRNRFRSGLYAAVRLDTRADSFKSDLLWGSDGQLTEITFHAKPAFIGGLCFARERVLLLWRVRLVAGRVLECDFALFAAPALAPVDIFGYTYYQVLGSPQ